MLSTLLKVIISLTFIEKSFTFDVQTKIEITNLTFANICGSSIFNLNCLEFCPYGTDRECKTPGFTCFKANLNDIINTCDYNSFCGSNGMYSCSKPCPSRMDRECYPGSYCYKLPSNMCNLSTTLKPINLSTTTLPTTTLPATTLPATTLPTTTLPTTTLPITTLSTTSSNNKTQNNTIETDTTETPFISISNEDMVNNSSKIYVNFLYYFFIVFFYSIFFFKIIIF